MINVLQKRKRRSTLFLEIEKQGNHCKMESNNTEMCKSLKEWFKTLNVYEVKGSNSGLDLSDGVAMAKALHKFSPDFFSGMNLFDLFLNYPK